MVHVLSHWNWSQGDTVDVWVYTNCETAVELFLNDVSLGSDTIDPSFPRLEWQVPFEPGTLRAVCTMDGAFEITDEVTTNSDPASIRLTVDRNQIYANARDLAFITADILDGSDAFMPNANNDVSFSVSGPGEIVGVDNGEQADNTPFKNTSRAAFSGKVLAIVQSTGQAGDIVVTATSGGLSQGTVTVTAQ
jgi:beta-galactosidase